MCTCVWLAKKSISRTFSQSLAFTVESPLMVITFMSIYPSLFVTFVWEACGDLMVSALNSGTRGLDSALASDIVLCS